MKSQTLNALRILAITAVVTLANIGPAEAGRVTGRFDPSFGADGLLGIPPALNLGWEGTADFTVPDACLAAPGLNNTPLNTPSCVGMRMELLEVSFYTNDAAHTRVGYFDIDFRPLLPFVSSPVTAIHVNGDQTIGGISAPGTLPVFTFQVPIFGEAFKVAGADAAYNVLNDLWFNLSFDIVDGPSLSYCRDADIYDVFNSGYGVKLPSCIGAATGGSDPNIPVTYSFRNLNLVPEPGTISLVFAALAIGAVVRRQRRN